MESKTYPIAEIFTAPHGEGAWSGTLMTFVRFAGCNVGRAYSPEARAAANSQLAASELPILASYQEECRLYDGRTFPCDTNYQLAERLTAVQIAQRIEAEHVCITGGEPLLHDLVPVIGEIVLARRAPQFHFETSGTKNPSWIMGAPSYWVAVSPKKGYWMQMLMRANEIRVLVDTSTADLEEFKPWINKVWLSPVNGEKTIDVGNARHCLALQAKYPQARITVQLHKILGCR